METRTHLCKHVGGAVVLGTWLLIFFFQIRPFLNEALSYTASRCMILQSTAIPRYCCYADCDDGCLDSATLRSVGSTANWPNCTQVLNSLVSLSSPSDCLDAVANSSQCPPKTTLCAGGSTSCCSNCFTVSSTGLHAITCQCESVSSPLCHVKCPVCVDHLVQVQISTWQMFRLVPTIQWVNLSHDFGANITVASSNYLLYSSRTSNETELACYLNMNMGTGFSQRIMFPFDQLPPLASLASWILLAVPSFGLFLYLCALTEEWIIARVISFEHKRSANFALWCGLLIPIGIILPILRFGVIDDFSRQSLAVALSVVSGLGWMPYVIILLQDLMTLFRSVDPLYEVDARRMAGFWEAVILYFFVATPLCTLMVISQTLPYNQQDALRTLYAVAATCTIALVHVLYTGRLYLRKCCVGCFRRNRVDPEARRPSHARSIPPPLSSIPVSIRTSQADTTQVTMRRVDSDELTLHEDVRGIRSRPVLSPQVALLARSLATVRDSDPFGLREVPAVTNPLDAPPTP